MNSRAYQFLISTLLITLTTISAFSQVNPLENNLVAWYPFNGNAIDESGNGNDGVINGANLTEDRFGNPDQAYLFDGNDYILVNASQSINSVNNEGTTICAWIKTINYVPVTAPSFLYYGVGTGQPAFCNFVWMDTLINACNFIQQSNRGDCYSTTKIFPETWYFVTNVYDEQNSIIKVYVNGVLEGEQPYDISNPINPRIEIGRDPYAGGSQYFDGVIDDIRIYNRSLNNTEIDSLYHEGGWDIEDITFTKQEVGLIPVNYGNKRCVQFVDVNNDNLLDLFATGSTNTSGTVASSMIYLNNGNNTFSQLSGLPFSGFFGSEADWADYNNDGFLDLLIAAESNGSPGGGGIRVYKNNGDSTFTQILHLYHGYSVQWIDYNNDGKKDIVTADGAYYSGPYLIRLYRNEGNDTFTEDTTQSFPVLGSDGYNRLAGIDYDNNGYLDLIVLGVDDSGIPVEYLFGNNGDGSFSIVTSSLLPDAGNNSLAIFDYNNDGYLDIRKNNEYFNTNDSGTGTFTSILLNNVNAMAGGNDVGDYNNDGLPDILACGSMGQVIDTKVYRNDGSNSFTDIQPGITSLAVWSSVKWGDYNKDGYLDFLMAGYLHTNPYKATELWKSSGGNNPNTPPTEPVTLNSSVNGTQVMLSWGKATDAETNQNALTYNVRVGVSPGGNEILACSSDETTGFRRIAQLGNAGTSLLYILKDLPIGTYYWSVQAVDQTYTGGIFAPEETFTITDPINDCLVAYYPFNGNADDESGNGNDGTVNGPVLTTDRFGNPNSAYYFDGSNDYIIANNSPSFSSSTVDKTTLCAWVKSSSFSLPGNQIIHLGGNYTVPAYELYVPFNQDKIAIKSYKWQFPWYYCYSTISQNLDEWYFVAAVLDHSNSKIKLYVNGVLNNQINETPTLPLNPRLEIGRNPWPESYHHGIIDDVRIFNCALDSTQIWQLYTMEGILLDMPDTLMACHDEIIELDAGADYSSYLWNTGETTQTILAIETGTYSVSVEDGFGNSATDSTYVNIINAHIAQNDTTISAGESIGLTITGGGPANITDGLVAWYPFNGNANDESGNGHDGIINGASLSQDRFGNLSCAYSFDGTDDFIQLSNPQTIHFGTQDFSISLWVKNNIENQNNDILVKSQPSSWISGNKGLKMTDGGPRFGCYGIGIPKIAPDFTVEVWHHVIVTHDNNLNSIKYYIDNTIYTYLPPWDVIDLPPDNLSDVLYLGRNGEGWYLNAYLDDIRIYNRVLSPVEIEELFYEATGSISYFWSTGDTNSTINVSPTTTTTYYCEITDGINWCTDSVTISIEHQIQLDLKVFLEGPYFNNGMTPFLNAFNVIPFEQPYNPALPYYNNSSPQWLYSGSEQLSDIPTNMVDWVVVQLRDAPTAAEATSATILDSKAGILMNDGSIKEVDGVTPISLHGVPESNLYVVIYHRNHLAIMSNYALTESGGIYTYDFTNGIDKVFGGNNGHKELDDNVWGMVAGDGNGNGIIQNTDETNVWKTDLGVAGYLGGDFDLNSIVQNTDETNIWKVNLGKGGQIGDQTVNGYKSQVPK